MRFFIQEKIKLNYKDFLIFEEELYKSKPQTIDLEDIKENFAIINERFKS